MRRPPVLHADAWLIRIPIRPHTVPFVRWAEVACAAAVWSIPAPHMNVEVRYCQVMRIATWNVNGLRARMEFITHWLKSRAPDVVGLQEVKVSDEDFPHADFSALGYHAVVHGEKGWNGVAVLSRTPAEAETLGLPGRENDGARLLRVQVSGLHFATVYCPNGKTLDHPDFPVSSLGSTRYATTSLVSTGMSRSSLAGISTSSQRHWTAGSAPQPTVRSSAPPRSDPGTGLSSI